MVSKLKQTDGLVFQQNAAWQIAVKANLSHLLEAPIHMVVTKNVKCLLCPFWSPHTLNMW